MNFKPQLLYRSNPDTSKLPYPLFYSPKLDGIRCAVIPDVGPVSRTLKEPPNKHLRDTLRHLWRSMIGFDGEIIVGGSNAPDVFSRTDTFWKSHAPKDNFSFHVFDDFTYPNDPYSKRYERLVHRVLNFPTFNGFNLFHVPHGIANNEEELLQGEEEVLAEGYEGLIIRIPSGRYKYNRTTLREMNAFKLKRFIDSEAVIIGYVEKLHNANELIRNDLGYVKRQTLQENMIPAGMLGSLIVRDIQENDESHKFFSVEFNVGSGFTDALRQHIWLAKKQFIGRTLTYKYLGHGAKDAPRHPIFKSFRHASDF